MPKPTKGPRLGGSPAHERLMLSNLACALFENKAITTTEAHTKHLQPLTERLVTKARRGDLHAHRQVPARLRNKSVIAQLSEEIAPTIDSQREGDYTRLVKAGNRRGDNAPLIEISLVLEAVEKEKKTSAPTPKAEAPKEEEPKSEEAPAGGSEEETTEKKTGWS